MFCFAVLAAMPLPSAAQPFSTKWQRVGAPGGASGSDVFQLRGSTGQAEASVIAGGSYRVKGGFWPGVLALQSSQQPIVPTRVSVTPDHGVPGAAFTASGQVAPGSAGVRLLWDDGVKTVGLFEGPVDDEGSFEAALQVPSDAAPGAHRVIALPFGSTGGDQGSAPFTVDAPAPGSLSGRIALNDTTPITGATVRLLDPRGNPLTTTVTDAQGEYSFPDLTAGAYMVVAIKDGFFIAEQDSEVPSGGSSFDTLQPLPLGDLQAPAPAVITFVGGIALPLDALSSFNSPVLVSDQISAKNTGVIASFASLPPSADEVLVRFWADATFPENVPQGDRAVLFEVLTAQGTSLWKVKKSVLAPVFASEPVLNFPAYTSATPTLIQGDMNVSAFPPGEVYLRVTPFIGNQPGFGKLYMIEMTDLTGRWFVPWVKPMPDPQTDLPVRYFYSSGDLHYIFNATLPNSAVLPFTLNFPVPFFDYTFANELNVGVPWIQEVFVATPGEGLRPGVVKPQLDAYAKLMNQEVLDGTWVHQPVVGSPGQPPSYAIKQFTAAGPTTFATIPIYQNGPGVDCWDPCPDIVCGCDCPVCLGWKLSIEFTLGGQLDLRSTIKNNLGLEVDVIPSVSGTLGGYLKAAGLICGANAHVSGTVTVELPFRYESQSDSAGFLEPCVKLSGSIGADIGCLGVGFGGGGTIGPEEIFGCAATASALQAEVQSAANTLFVDPAPAVAANGTGQAMTVWVQDESADPTAIQPVLHSRYFTGSAWEEPQPITPAPALVYDPKVAFLGPERALAVWVQNQQTIAEALEAGRAESGLRDLRFAVWADGAWSRPTPLTEDNHAEGLPALIADPELGVALAAWVRRLNEPSADSPQGAYAVVYATFDGAAWSEPTPITLNEPSIDYQVALARDAAGNFWAAWTRDADGDLTTFDDRQILVAAFSNREWREPEIVRGTPSGAFAPAIALDTDGEPLVVFTEPPMIGDELTSGLSNRSALWAAYRRQGVWETARVGAEVFAETPQVKINSNKEAIIMFRRFSRGDLRHRDGDLSGATADLSQATLRWTSAYLTDDGESNWEVAFDLDRATERHFVVNVKQSPLTSRFAPGAQPQRRLAATRSVRLHQTAPNGPALASMVFEGQPDLVISAEDIAFSNSHPAPSETVTVTATVRNQGVRALTEAASFVVSFYDASPTGGAQPFQQVTVTQALRLGEAASVNAEYTVRQGGLRTITVVVDANRQIAESDEDNNVASATLGQTPAPTQLVVTPDPALPATTLEWTAPETTGIARYEILRATAVDGPFELIGFTSETSYVDRLVRPTGIYHYRVVAIDDYDARSGFGELVNVALPELPDVELAPMLSILEAERAVGISWFDPTGEFVLQETDTLARGEWMDVTEPAFVHAGQHQAFIQASGQVRFFRATRR